MDTQNPPPPVEFTRRVRKQRKSWRLEGILQAAGLMITIVILAGAGYTVWRKTSQDRTQMPAAQVSQPSTASETKAAGATVPEASDKTGSKARKTMQQLIQETKEGRTTMVSEAADSPSTSSSVASAKPGNVEELQTEVKKDFANSARVIRDFFRLLGRSNTEIMPLLRHAEAVIPKYERWKTLTQIAPAENLQIGPKFMTLDRFVIVPVPLADGSSRLAVLEKTEDGAMKLDWESFAAWCERPFEDLAACQDGERTLLRVLAQRTSSIPPFGKEGEGVSLTLSHPEESLTLNAWLPTSQSAHGGKATQYLAEMKKRSMATLVVYMDAESRAHGWLKVAEVPNMGWVTGLNQMP